MSSPAQVVSLKRTPLYDLHRELGARLIDFGGWEMPVQYHGILEEHRAVRERAGLFDVSHMGELEFTGPGALEALQWLTPNDVGKLAAGRCHYSAFLTERGTFVTTCWCTGAPRTPTWSSSTRPTRRRISRGRGTARAQKRGSRIAAASTVGTDFSVDIRGRSARARVVETPFYKRTKEVPA